MCGSTRRTPFPTGLEVVVLVVVVVVVVVVAAAAAAVVAFEEAVPEITVAKSDVNHLQLRQSIEVLLH